MWRSVALCVLTLGCSPPPATRSPPQSVVVAAAPSAASAPPEPSADVRAFETCARRPEHALADPELAAAVARVTSRLDAKADVPDADALALWGCFAVVPADIDGRWEELYQLATTAGRLRNATLAPIVRRILEDAKPDEGAVAKYRDKQAVLVLVALGDESCAAKLFRWYVRARGDDSEGVAQLALLRYSRATEPLVVAALDGRDPEISSSDRSLWKIATDSARPAIRAAYLRACDRETDTRSKIVCAESFTQLPPGADLGERMRALYAAVDVEQRPYFLERMGRLDDASLFAFVADETIAAQKGAKDVAMGFAGPGLRAASLLARKQHVKKLDAVYAAVRPRLSGLDIAEHRGAADALAACGDDVRCHLAQLDPMPSSTNEPRQIKSARMVGALGSRADALALVAKLKPMWSLSVRVALLDAIDRLCPAGDREVADALEAASAELEKTDKTGSFWNRRTVLRLRARLP